MSHKKPSWRDGFEKKEIEEGKETKLEKNDFLALMIACASVALPLILIFIAGLALFIWAFTSFVK